MTELMDYPALRRMFSFPTPEELAKLDSFEMTCRECGASWEVVMLNHCIVRGTVNSLTAHAMSHQPGRPGMRRIA